jgi:sugar phosphate isomerase/epimerase
MTHALCLEQITAWGLSPPDFVHLGAQLGCAAVSLWVQSPTPQAIAPPLVEDAALHRATKAALTQTGLGVITVECFVLAPETDISTYEPALAAGAELQAKAATVIAFDPETARQQENFNRLAALAAQYQLALNIEFIAFSTVPNLAAAQTLVQNSKLGNAGIVVDSAGA